MMLIQGPGLLVSLPPEELRGFAPPASLFQLADLHGAPLSRELRWALHAALGACTQAQARMLLVARPEIFTHDASLGWLQDQLMGIRDHLCLSDGTAIRPVSGMRNHLFLYKDSRLLHAAAFQRLLGWVPELLDSVESQVNTAFSARSGRRTIRPATLELRANLLPDPQTQLFRYWHHANPEVSVSRTLKAPAELPRAARHVSYVPLTETACDDAPFIKGVVSHIHAAQRTNNRSVVLRLPHVATTDDLEPRLRLVLTALRRVRLRNAVRVGTLFFAADDPPAEALTLARTVQMIAPESYESWRYAAPYVAALQACAVGTKGSSA